MSLSTAQLDALPPGSAVRCTTERGRRTSLALKLSIRELQVLRNALIEVEDARERVLAALPAGVAS